MPMEMERIAMRRRHFSKRLACDCGRDNPEKQQHQHHPTLLAFPESQAPLADGWWVVVVVIAFGLNRFQPLTAVPARRSQYDRYVIGHSGLQTERPARKSRDDEQTCFDCNTRRSKKENLLASPALNTPTPTTTLSPTSMTQAATSERATSDHSVRPARPFRRPHPQAMIGFGESEARRREGEPRSSALSVSSPILPPASTPMSAWVRRRCCTPS